MKATRALPVSMCLALAASAVVHAIPASAKVVTLRVWTWVADASEANYYKNWVADYEKSHPNVKIKLDTANDMDKVLANYAAGTPIDVFRIGAQQLAQFAAKGLVRPVEGPMLKDIDKSDLLASVVTSGTFRGRFYGWDPHISGSTLAYNTSIFDKAGLRYPTHGFTWDDLTVAAAKTTITQSGKTTQWGFHDSGAFTLLRLLATCYDSPLLNTRTGEPRFLAEGLVKAVDMVRKMTLSHGCMPKSNSLSNATLFADGKLAMVVEGTFRNPFYMASRKLKYQVSWTPKGTRQAFFPWPCLWVMSKTSKSPKEQWDFYQHFLGLESSMEFTDFGGPRAYGAPVWKSALKNPKYKVCDMLNEQLTEDDFAQPDPLQAFTNTERFVAEADQTMWRVFGGTMGTEQGLDLLNKRAKAIMKFLGN